jgi:hypothetical protein
MLGSCTAVRAPKFVKFGHATIIADKTERAGVFTFKENLPSGQL